MAAFQITLPLPATRALSLTQESRSCSVVSSSRTRQKHVKTVAALQARLQSSFVPARRLHASPLRPVVDWTDFSLVVENVAAGIQQDEHVGISTIEDGVHGVKLLVDVIGKDRVGLLEDILLAFRTFGFTISKATVDTRDNLVNDQFIVSHEDGTLTAGSDLVVSLNGAILDALRGIETKPNFEDDPCQLPVRSPLVDSQSIEDRVSIKDDPDISRTEVSVKCRDRPFLLHDIVSTLRYLELDIQSADILTDGGKVLDKFYVTSHNGRLDSGTRLAVVNALTAVLMCKDVVSDDFDSY